MAEPTADEQLFLELINRARLDPAAEALRTGVSLGTITAAPKQPLAFNLNLNDAADSHSSHMLAVDIFSHDAAGDGSPGQRMVSAGYTGAYTWGENIAWNGTSGTLNVTSSIFNHHDMLFRSSGHRANILNDNFKEIGIGSIAGNYKGWNALMTTQNFASAGSGSFVTGVIYNDQDRNAFYSVGEGRGNVGIEILAGASSLGSGSSWSAGGYSLKTTATGQVTVKFSGGGLPETVGAIIDMASNNAKVDLVNGSRIASSVSAELAFAAKSLKLLGIADLDGTGTDRANVLIGNSGDNDLSGAAGGDVLRGLAGSDHLDGGAGRDRLLGGAGDDMLTGGVGADIFIFSPASNSGQDTISDFVDGKDKIRFTSAGTMDFSDLTITGNGTQSVHVVHGGGEIDVRGAGVITLSAADFDFLA
jgi:Ca2+-binding RTX toxin-like protein